MLILSRKPGESIVIDGRIIVKIIRVEGDMIKVGIEAPREVPVHRQEVYDEIQKNNQEALTNADTVLPRLSARGEAVAPVQLAAQLESAKPLKQS
jgi:carbon storage regulator